MQSSPLLPGAPSPPAPSSARLSSKMQWLHLLCLSLLVLGCILDGKREPLRLPFLWKPEDPVSCSLFHFQQTFRRVHGWGSVTAFLHPLLVTCPKGTLSCSKSRQEPAGPWGWKAALGKGRGAILPPSALAQPAHTGLGSPRSHSSQHTGGASLAPFGVRQPWGASGRAGSGKEGVR